MASVAAIRDHYDSLAFVYQTFWGDHLHHGLFVEPTEEPQEAQVRMLDHCIGLLVLDGDEEVLDLGCGHGGTLLHLARRLRCGGMGVTLSPAQARIARDAVDRARLTSRLKILVDDVAIFPFPAAAFDLVWAMESSEHFADKPKFLRDVGYTLRPEGKLLVTAWTGSMEQSCVRDVARAFLCPELWTAEQYRESMEDAGLVIQHCEDVTSRVLRTWEICRERARLAEPLVKMLPRAARAFVDGIDTILAAYRSGDLRYTILTARMP
jgi:tocopherol O-methyltransferase